MDQKQLGSLKKHNEQLAQFIIRLSNFYEGASSDIDKELGVLRGHLIGNQNTTLANISIKKVNDLLMQNSNSLKKQTSDTIGKIETALKKLQRSEFISDDLKSETARFLSSLSLESGSVFASLPQFERALFPYQQAIENGKSDKKVTVPSSSPTSTTDVQNAPSRKDAMTPLDERLHGQICVELQQLIEPFYLKNQNYQQLADVRKKLLDGISHQELLECCLVLIRLIVKEAVREAGVNGKVIDGLHKTIISINSDVSSSLEITQTQIENKAKHTQTLQTHIEDMGELVTQSDDLENLKTEAQAYLEKMQSSIAERAEVEKEEEQQLVTLLQNMQKELTALERKTQQYRKKLLEQRLQTHTDPLTKIPNRIAYNERMEQEYLRFKRNGSPLCMAVVDIDHFKQINDKYGHAAGDKTLQVIAKQLKANLRKTDFLARWGGEEFVLLFPDTTLDDILEPLDTLRVKLEGLPFKFKQEPVSITASFGVAQFDSKDTIESVFERADKHLYTAKNNGRNQIRSDKD